MYAAAAGNSSQGHVVLDRNRLAGRYSPFAPQNARVNPNIVREYGDGGRMDPLPPNHMSVNQIRVGDIVTRDVSLLIFDINGYEYQALKGALGIFHQYLLDYVYFPALDVAALREIGGESIYKLFHFLDQFHFKVHCLPPLPASAAAADPQPGAVREILAGTDAGKYLYVARLAPRSSPSPLTAPPPLLPQARRQRLSAHRARRRRRLHPRRRRLAPRRPAAGDQPLIAAQPHFRAALGPHLSPPGPSPPNHVNDFSHGALPKV